MDLDSIGTGLTILGTAEVSKDSIQRMLAPTADYIGAGVLHSTQAAVNTARVLAKAAARLGDKVDSGGSIPPRVIKNVMDEAPWINDELMAEYLGGILASSFGDRVRDDRAVALQSTLRRLSSYSVRTHYTCYSKYYLQSKGRIRWSRMYDDLDNVQRVSDERMFARHQDFAAFMEVPSVGDEYTSIILHSFGSLEREELLTVRPWGDRAFLNRELSKDGIRYVVPDDGFIYNPVGPGEELFLWALGRGDLTAGNFPDVDLEVEVSGLPLPEGFHRLEDLEERRTENWIASP